MDNYNHPLLLQRLTALTPTLVSGDPIENAYRLAQSLNTHGRGSDCVVTSELALTGPGLQDVYATDGLLAAALEGLQTLLIENRLEKTIVVVGMPLEVGAHVVNAAVVIQGQKILGVVPKTWTSEPGLTNDARWFTSSQALPCQTLHLLGQTVPVGADLLFVTSLGLHFGVEVGSDLEMPLSPSTRLAAAGAEVILHLGHFHLGLQEATRINALLQTKSAQSQVAYLSAGAAHTAHSGALRRDSEARYWVGGRDYAPQEHTTEATHFTWMPLLVKGLRRKGARFNRLALPPAWAHEWVAQTRAVAIEVDPMPQLLEAPEDALTPLWVDPYTAKTDDDVKAFGPLLTQIFASIDDRLKSAHAQKMVIGLSGGSDSAMTLALCVSFCRLYGYDLSRIVAVTMPGLGTTGTSLQLAKAYAASLGIELREISIAELARSHLRAIGHDAQSADITFENAQARIRAQLLMDIANHENGLVMGTSSLSEVALGWCTYGGDQLSMFNVNGGLLKSYYRRLAAVLAKRFDLPIETLNAILARRPSPELVPVDEGHVQASEAIVGDYEVVDFLIGWFHTYGASATQLKALAHARFGTQFDTDRIVDTFMTRTRTQQFKRLLSPDGPTTMGINLSPAGGWQMPCDVAKLY